MNTSTRFRKTIKNLYLLLDPKQKKKLYPDSIYHDRFFCAYPIYTESNRLAHGRYFIADLYSIYKGNPRIASDFNCYRIQ